jgi:hypothetical protein
MINKLLEEVEYLLNHSDNVYVTTLKVAILAKKKKSIELLSSERSKDTEFYKENIIVQSVNEIYVEKLILGE